MQDATFDVSYYFQVLLKLRRIIFLYLLKKDKYLSKKITVS